MTYALEFSSAASRQLRKIDPAERLRLVGALELLKLEPRPPGATMLRGGDRGRWRVRVGDYRIVYAIDDGRLVILVLRVGHRREVYDS